MGGSPTLWPSCRRDPGPNRSDTHGGFGSLTSGRALRFVPIAVPKSVISYSREGAVMRRFILGALVLAGVLGALTPAVAQQTTGSIVGRVIDEQKAAVPGATITAKNLATGFTRVATSDPEGLYRLSALPVGTYDLTIELQGFATIDRKGIAVNVGQTFTIDFDLTVAKMSETVVVTGETPLVETTSSSVGGVVDVNKIEALP